MPRKGRKSTPSKASKARGKVRNDRQTPSPLTVTVRSDVTPEPPQTTREMPAPVPASAPAPAPNSTATVQVTRLRSRSVPSSEDTPHRSRSRSDDESSSGDESNSDDDSGDSKRPRKKRAVDTKETLELGLFTEKGRYLARAYACWGNPQDILVAGNLYRDYTREQLEDLDEQKYKHFEIYKAVFEIGSRWDEVIRKAKLGEIGEVDRQMRRGQCSARLVDTLRIKDLILDWVFLSSDPALLAKKPASKSQSLRGFENDVTAELLRPVEAASLTPELLKELQTDQCEVTGLDGVVRRLDGSNHRVFQYENHWYDQQDLLKGWLKGRLLVYAYRAIFTSPSSMTRVTPASIAYVTVQVYFALSSRSSFNPHTFNELQQMYNHINAMFSSRVPRMKQYFNQLLVWWDSKIFSAVRRNDRGVLNAFERFYDDQPVSGTANE